MDNPKQLIIALEPEAAAIFCMERKVSHLENELGREIKDEEISQPNTEYMVVDIGGELNINCSILFMLMFV